MATPHSYSTGLPTTIRPDARRPYDEELQQAATATMMHRQRHHLPQAGPSSSHSSSGVLMGSGKGSDGLSNHHQSLHKAAANYASLAPVSHSVSAPYGTLTDLTPSSSLPTSSHRSRKPPSSSPMPSESASLAPPTLLNSSQRHPSAQSKQTVSRGTATTAALQDGPNHGVPPPASFYTSSLAASAAPASYQEDDSDEQAGWDAAPRLSMSSCESSGGSEVKTPESMNANLAWRANSTADENVASLSVNAPTANLQQPQQQQQQYVPHSPGLVDMSDGLASAGFGMAERVALSSINNTLVDAAQQMDDEQNDHRLETSTARVYNGASDATTPGRSVTIKGKRPDGLLKLSSYSYQTDRTVTPCSSEPSTAEPTSTVVEHDNPLERRDLSAEKGAGGHSIGSTKDALPNARAPSREHASSSSVFQFPSLPSSSSSSRLGDASSIDTLEESRVNYHNRDAPLESPIARTATSPDSWRSLLPEHDPYFIPPLEPSSMNHPDGRQASTSASVSATAARLKGMTLEQQQRSSDGSRRWSGDSQRSTFSLPGPVAVSTCGSYSASSSLYDLDGSFNSSGSRAAFAPLQYSYNQSSRSLASPTPSTGGFSDAGRASVTGKLAESITDQQRRHASFSTFDQRNAQNRAAFQHAPFVHPDYIAASSRTVRGSPPISQRVHSSGIAKQAESAVASSVKSFGSDDGRENWPSSRNSMQSVSSSQPYGHTSSSEEAPVGMTGAQQREPECIDDGSADTQHDVIKQDDRNVGTGTFSGPAIPSLPPSAVVTTSTVSSSPSVISSSMMESVHPDLASAFTTTHTTTTTTTTTYVHHRPFVSSQSDVVVGGRSPPLELESRPLAPLQTPTSSNLARSASLQPFTLPKNTTYEVSPLSPPSLPFLDSRPAPSSTDFSIETQPTTYTLKTKLPGFTLDGITLATKHHCQLVIVADKWDESNGGHFERRITFGPDADLKATRASFDGTLLKITVPRRR